jgi:hypothetical protein
MTVAESLGRTVWTVQRLELLELYKPLWLISLCCFRLFYRGEIGENRKSWQYRKVCWLLLVHEMLKSARYRIDREDIFILPQKVITTACFIQEESSGTTAGIEPAIPKGRGFDSHRGQANFQLARCGMWMHTQSNTTNIIFTWVHNTNVIFRNRI